jgi:hypothetical protein
VASHLARPNARRRRADEPFRSIARLTSPRAEPFGSITRLRRPGAEPFGSTARLRRPGAEPFGSTERSVPTRNRAIRLDRTSQETWRRTTWLDRAADPPGAEAGVGRRWPDSLLRHRLPRARSRAAPTTEPAIIAAIDHQPVRATCAGAARCRGWTEGVGVDPGDLGVMEHPVGPRAAAGPACSGVLGQRLLRLGAVRLAGEVLPREVRVPRRGRAVGRERQRANGLEGQLAPSLQSGLRRSSGRTCGHAQRRHAGPGGSSAAGAGQAAGERPRGRARC